MAVSRQHDPQASQNELTDTGENTKDRSDVALHSYQECVVINCFGTKE